MTTAVDTNIFVVLFSGTAGEAQAARLSRVEASKRRPLVTSPPVYGELVVASGRAVEEIDAFLSRTRVEVDWALDEDTWRKATFAYRAYAERRRAQRDGPSPRRILADFVIGAHALHHASALGIRWTKEFTARLFRS